MATPSQNPTSEDSADDILHLLKSLDQNAAPPRADDLQTIREATHRDFLASNKRTGFTARPSSAPSRRSAWFALASVTASLVFTVWLLQPVNQKPDSSAPLAEVRLVAINEPVASDSFRIARSLKDDGRAGSISEIHGLVFVRAFPGHRWTPASPSMPLFIGDQIRCESRRANAAVLRLYSGDEITLGPAAVLEISREANVRLLNGDAKVKQSSRLAPPSEASEAA